MHIYVNAIMYPFGFKHFSFDGNIINANNGMINMLTLIECQFNRRFRISEIVTLGYHSCYLNL